MPPLPIEYGLGGTLGPGGGAISERGSALVVGRMSECVESSFESFGDLAIRWALSEVTCGKSTSMYLRIRFDRAWLWVNSQLSASDAGI